MSEVMLNLFGKHPSHDDFIIASPGGHGLASLAAWLLESMEWANARGGPKWSGAFASGGTRAFVFRVPGKTKRIQLVVGALRPSRDRSGRLFPLVAAAEVTLPADRASEVESLPIVFEELWQHAEEALLRIAATPELDPEKSAEAPLRLDISAAEPYHQWTQSLQTDELWQLLFGSNPSAPPKDALGLLQECVSPLRNTERPTTPLTLRLPLGSSGGAGVCFWLDLTRRSARWSKTVPSFFWSHDDDAGSMLLHLGNPPKSTLSELWLPTNERDEICDVSLVPDVASSLTDQPPPAVTSEVNYSDSAPVSELLQAASVS